MLLRWVLLAVAVYGTSLIAESFRFGEFKLRFRTIALDSPMAWGKLLVGVAVLSLLNATLGRILKILAIPLRCLTLGFFSLVINAIVFYVVARLEIGFRVAADPVQGFVAAFFASLIVSAVNGLLLLFLPDDKED